MLSYGGVEPSGLRETAQFWLKLLNQRVSVTWALTPNWDHCSIQYATGRKASLSAIAQVPDHCGARGWAAEARER